MCVGCSTLVRLAGAGADNVLPQPAHRTSSGPESSLDAGMAETMGTTEVSVSPEAGTEIRRLAHDLSNSLEVIIQASYLLQISNLEGDAKKWAEMVDQGAQQAAEINRKLRECIRANTTKA